MVMGMAGIIVLVLLVALILLASKGDDSKDDKESKGEVLLGAFCTPQKWPENALQAAKFKAASRGQVRVEFPMDSMK